MSSESFQALLPIICSDVIKIIAQKKCISQIKATQLLYNSKLYSMLEDKNTDVWHYSSLLIYNLLEEELELGKIEFPDV